MSLLVAPRAPARSRSDRLRAPALTIGLLSATTLALRLRDPHQHASWGLCPSAALGFWCPGCGGLRAVNDLTHGHPLEAASSNLLLIVVMPFAIGALALWAVDRYRGVHRTVPVAARWALVGVAAVAMITFTVLRNTPAGAWLAP